jgi:hypothetical protein
LRSGRSIGVSRRFGPKNAWEEHGEQGTDSGERFPGSENGDLKSVICLQVLLRYDENETEELEG